MFRFSTRKDFDYQLLNHLGYKLRVVVLNVVTARRVDNELRVLGELTQSLDSAVARAAHFQPLFSGCARWLSPFPSPDDN
jgi:hypothetical protein